LVNTLEPVVELADEAAGLRIIDENLTRLAAGDHEAVVCVEHSGRHGAAVRTGRREYLEFSAA
jgi:hypothetical protein